MQQAAKFWDRAAENYAKSPIKDMESYEYTLGRIKSCLSESDQVLEVGCGTGSTSLLLAPAVAQVTASDISRNMIRIAEQKASKEGVQNVSFVTSDVFDATLDQGPYDAVLALNVIHLIDDTPGAMKRISQLVKPGGTFISKTVCRPGKGTPFKFRLMLMILPLMQFFRKAPFVQFMEIPELEGHIADAGFKIIETSDSPPPSRFIIAKKLA